MAIGRANVVPTKGVLIDVIANLARKTKERRLLAVTLDSV
jgi:hypothetical protein